MNNTTKHLETLSEKLGMSFSDLHEIMSPKENPLYFNKSYTFLTPLR